MINAKELRTKDALQEIPNKAGYYKWWAERSELDLILSALGFDYDAVKDALETKENVFCVYVGIAAKESVRSRLNCHVNDPHTMSRVKNGTLSTLRQSIASVVAHNQADKAATDSFIDKLKIEYACIDEPIKSETAKEKLQGLEKDLMQKNLYALNIRDNHHPLAPLTKKTLMTLRKESKIKN